MVWYLLLNSKIRSPGSLYKTTPIRCFFGKNKALIVPPPALRQVAPPPEVKGHLKYQRYWSDNAKYVPQIRQGDTFSRALFGGFKKNFELYPFYFLASVYCLVTGLIFYYTSKTIEVGNPATKTWSVIREKYWKYYIFLYDIFGISHARFPLMEELLDEIEEASEKRRLEDEAREEAIRKYEENLENKH